MERKLVPVHREVAARLVPTGTETTIPSGVFVTLTQALGGTYTVVFKGNMVRIDAEDADALGFEPEVITFDEPENGEISDEQVWSALKTVHDPEIPVNIVDLGLVYDLQLDRVKGIVNVEMTLTSPACGMGDILVQDVKKRVARVPFVKSTEVNLVFDPPWSREKMSEEAQLDLNLF